MLRRVPETDARSLRVDRSPVPGPPSSESPRGDRRNKQLRGSYFFYSWRPPVSGIRFDDVIALVRAVKKVNATGGRTEHRRNPSVDCLGIPAGKAGKPDQQGDSLRACTSN